MHDVLEQLGRLRLVPMVVMDDAAHADGFGDALVAGGLPVAEVTFRTDAAEDSIRRLAKRGDLLSAPAPCSPRSRPTGRSTPARRSSSRPAPIRRWSITACCEACRSCRAWPRRPTSIWPCRSGSTTVKFFPAENLGGTATLKAYAGPYADMMFLPTGGITPEKLPDYLKLPFVLACGGSWLAPREALAKGDFATIRSRSKRQRSCWQRCAVVTQVSRVACPGASFTARHVDG